MLKERRNAVANVGAAFLEAEKAADDAAARGARCVAIFIEERGRANLPPQIGRRALDLLGEGARQALAARQCFVEAHALLADLPGEIGIRGSLDALFGDDTCPPNSAELEERPALGLVA